MTNIVIISGSPLAHSRTDKVLRYLNRLLEEKQCQVTYISVRDVPAEDLIGCRFDSPDIQHAVLALRSADSVIVGSPVYQASYSGVLKTLIDLLPMDILKGKPVLPVMTGGTKSHLLAMEYALKPPLSTLKGHTLKGIYLVDKEIDKDLDEPIIEESVRNRTHKQLAYFLECTENGSGSQTYQ